MCDVRPEDVGGRGIGFELRLDAATGMVEEGEPQAREDRDLRQDGHGKVVAESAWQAFHGMSGRVGKASSNRSLLRDRSRQAAFSQVASLMARAPSFEMNIAAKPRHTTANACRNRASAMRDARREAPAEQQRRSAPSANGIAAG